jgi:6-phosphofructokinase 1
MNSGIRALVKIAAYHGNSVTVYHEGADGMMTNNCEVLSPADCELWSMRGGCIAGASRKTINSTNVDTVLSSFTKLQLDCLVLFGGFEAVTSSLTLAKHASLPVYLVPATISNNVPGSDFSIGCDTALNTIVRSVDCIKQSAASARKRVFVIDVMGGNCGYLAVLSGLASGADAAYIPEQPVNIDELQCDAYRVMDKIEQGNVIKLSCKYD